MTYRISQFLSALCWMFSRATRVEFHVLRNKFCHSGGIANWLFLVVTIFTISANTCRDINSPAFSLVLSNNNNNLSTNNHGASLNETLRSPTKSTMSSASRLSTTTFMMSPVGPATATQATKTSMLQLYYFYFIISFFPILFISLPVHWPILNYCHLVWLIVSVSSSLSVFVIVHAVSTTSITHLNCFL